jgi:hypothetical protein
LEAINDQSGGQQGPNLVAAGAQVTVFDNSPLKLDQDHFVAAREGGHKRIFIRVFLQGDSSQLKPYNPTFSSFVVYRLG